MSKYLTLLRCSIKLRRKLKVEDIFKGEIEVLDLVHNFLKYLICWPDSRKWNSASRERRIKFISGNVVFSRTPAMKKPLQHFQLW